MSVCAMSINHIAFYPSDWLAGTRGMSDAETGVYITLICRMYEMAGPIERDDDRLSRLCGCKTKSRFVKALDYLLSEGKVVETENGIFNERVAKEIQKVVEKSTKGRDAAESRWRRKPNKNNGSTHANASPGHMPQPCQPEPELEPEVIDKESITKYMSDFEEFWSEYPKRRGTNPRKKAFEKYRAARKAGTSKDDILDGVKRLFKFVCDEDTIETEFVPMAATWLTQERWSDEL